jgi:hypothetical protein
MAEIETFDEFIQTVVRETWEVFRNDALLFVIAAALAGVLSAVTFGLLAGPLTVGFIELVRRSRRGEPVAVGIVFSRFDTLVPTLIAFVLIVIAVTIGLLLLVIPGVLAALFAAFTLHVIAYEGLPAIDAIKRSFELVRAYFLHTLALLFVVSIAQAIGGMVLFGIVVTMPISLIMMTLGFERLNGATMGQPLVAEP